MIVMVSTKTLSAREPDQSASTKPSEITSKRPPAEHVVDRRHDDLVDRALGQRPLGQVDHRVAHVVDLRRAELVGDEADRARHREDQRRHREHREEGGLGGQTGHPVAHAATDGGDDQPPDQVADLAQPDARTAEAESGAFRGSPHAPPETWLYRSHMRSDIRVATNQAPPLVGHNMVTADARPDRGGDPARVAPRWSTTWSRSAARPARAEAREHGMLANEHHPRLTPYDRYGNRIDEVEFHPSWHWLMERAIGHGLAATPWEQDASARARTARRGLHGLVAHRAGARLPDLDDVRRRARRCAPTTRWPRSGRRCWRRPRTTPASATRPPSSGRSPGWG